MVFSQYNPARLENYIRTIELVCDITTKFSLLDKQMSLLWASSDYQGPQSISGSVTRFKNTDSLAMFSLNLPEFPNCYLQPMELYNRGGVEFVLLQTLDPLSNRKRKVLFHQLCKAQGSIAECDLMQTTLKEKAIELRELHTRFNPDGVNSTIKDVVLEVENILCDCTESLSLSGAFLYTSDMQQMICEVPDESRLQDSGLSESRRDTLISKDIVRLCESSSSLLLLDQDAKTGVSFPSDCLDGLRVLVIPLFDIDKECRGVFVLVRQHTQTQFTKSEYRLAELLAQRTLEVLLSRYDPVSGLLGHTAYNAVLEKEFSNINKHADNSSFLLLKLYNLEQFYAAEGIEAGSHILTQVAALLTKRVRSRDLAGRIGKDEFVLVLNNCSVENTKIVANQILESVAQFTFEWQARPLKLEASIGIVTLSPSLVSANNHIRAAREAALLASESGKYKLAVFEGMKNKHSELSRLSWDNRIYKTVLNSEFKLFCQPIEDVGVYTDGIKRYELLLRLDSQHDVLVALPVFISAASKLGLMNYVDKWVVRQAFSLSHSINSHSTVALFNFTINLSADAINSEFADFIIYQAEKIGVAAKSICFDMTESVAMHNLRKTNRFISLLKKQGFEFALDDFGTGIGAYSSLRNLSVDYVKLNGRLVRSISHDTISASIVTSITQVCRSLGIKTIAESVENDVVKEKLIKTNVDYIQGYQMARPRAVEQEFQEYYNAVPSLIG